MKPTEKVVFVEFKGKTMEYTPENDYVIRDMKLYDNKAIIWLQYQNYLN